METRLHTLVARMKELEKKLALEIQKKEEEYYYKIFGKKVTFEAWIQHDEQKAMAEKIIPFIRNSTLPVILSAPVVWAVLPAAVLFDLMMSLFQAVCFPIYGIPKVKRVDHFISDRHALLYLNIIRKISVRFSVQVEYKSNIRLTRDFP